MANENPQAESARVRAELPPPIDSTLQLLFEKIEQLSLTNTPITVELHLQTQPQKVYKNCQVFENCSINTEDIDHLHRAEGSKQEQLLPEALCTQQARELLQKAQAAGMLDESYQYIGHKAKAAILAEEIGTLLGIYPLWKPFEELWNITNLRQTCYTASGTERGGRVRTEVRNILK